MKNDRNRCCSSFEPSSSSCSLGVPGSLSGYDSISFAASGSPSNARWMQSSSSATSYFFAPPLALIFSSSFILYFASWKSFFSSAFRSAVSVVYAFEFAPLCLAFGTCWSISPSFAPKSFMSTRSGAWLVTSAYVYELSMSLTSRLLTSVSCLSGYLASGLEVGPLSFGDLRLFFRPGSRGDLSLPAFSSCTRSPVDFSLAVHLSPSLSSGVVPPLGLWYSTSFLGDFLILF